MFKLSAVLVAAIVATGASASPSDVTYLLKAGSSIEFQVANPGADFDAFSYQVAPGGAAQGHFSWDYGFDFMVDGCDGSGDPYCEDSPIYSEYSAEGAGEDIATATLQGDYIYAWGVDDSVSGYNGYLDFINDGAANISITLPSSRLTLVPPTAPPSVPEPASWAMAVSGFGLTGGALRRRKMALVSGKRA